MSSPANLVLRSRDINFAIPASTSRWWANGDPIATAFFNALSASFPEGERFFMDAVRKYRDVAPPELKRQIAIFMTQEALHSREHIAFNWVIEGQGYDLKKINAFSKASLDKGRSEPAIQQLAATAALEHFTAILAHAALKDPRHLSQADGNLRRLWQWHAIEEIEHKSVTFDVFLMATKDMHPLRRYTLRVVSMVAATAIFVRYMRFAIAELFRQDGIDRPLSWLKLAHFLYVRPGLGRQVTGSYLSYFRPGFHPWEVDDRELVSAAEVNLRALSPVSAMN